MFAGFCTAPMRARIVFNFFRSPNDREKKPEQTHCLISLPIAVHRMRHNQHFIQRAKQTKKLNEPNERKCMHALSVLFFDCGLWHSFFLPFLFVGLIDSMLCANTIFRFLLLWTVFFSHGSHFIEWILLLFCVHGMGHFFIYWMNGFMVPIVWLESHSKLVTRNSKFYADELSVVAVATG